MSSALLLYIVHISMYLDSIEIAIRDLEIILRMFTLDWWKYSEMWFNQSPK